MLDAGIYEQLSRLVIAMKQKSSQNMAATGCLPQKPASVRSPFRVKPVADHMRGIM